MGKRESGVFYCIKWSNIAQFSKKKIIYNFAFHTSLGSMLTLKNDQNNQRPIHFMSSNLKGHEINYHAIDKKAYVVYTVVSHFWPYFLKNHCIIFVLHLGVNSLFIQ